MKYLVVLTDYGGSFDIIRIGNMRCATLRWYNDSNWGIRHLAFDKYKWTRFAIDLGRLSIVFENYNRR